MNVTMVDVSDIGGVQAGDETVLPGQQNQEVMSADELPGWTGTISDEVLC
ncbi:MAG: hypothetical protein CSB34_02340 [Desulfobulbus propionicus]|nr:MAG: hypothetical protein CSB34_02340 [Desulfobulbus propionicus]